LVEKSLGLSVLPMNPQIARQLGVPDGTGGLVISVVDQSSDAGSKGLQRGDIVLSANYTDVKTVAELETIVRAAKADGRAAVLLRIQRRGQPAAYLPVRLR
jgi:serine protease Do